MPNYLRPRIAAASVFFTVTLAQRGSALLVREIEGLRAAVRATRADHPFRIDAWVVLPDHMHCIWTLPQGDADYSLRWKKIKARFTKAVGALGPRSASKIAKGEAGLWQRRFWDHHLRDDQDFALHVQYCWGDPVRHGLVRRPADWRYSSIHRDIGAGRVEPDWVGHPISGQFGE